MWSLSVSELGPGTQEAKEKRRLDDLVYGALPKEQEPKSVDVFEKA